VCVCVSECVCVCVCVCGGGMAYQNLWGGKSMKFAPATPKGQQFK